jgi:Na+/phosphate symporter
MGETITLPAPVSTNTGSSTSLLNREESEHFRTRWNEIQGKFVDEPRSAVQQADALVSEVIEQITQMFAKEHSSLEGQWKQGNEVSTEDFRKALQRYRSFFNRLVI